MAAILSLLASPIAAQQCGDRSVIVAALAERYNESHRFVGLTSGGQMIEAFAAPSGPWTILLSSPNGTSCVVSVGELFEVIAPPPEGVPG